MSDRSYLTWPFFEPRHRDLADRVEAWAAATLPGLVDHHDVDGSCRRLVAALGQGGWLDLSAPVDGAFDVRAICLVREGLARHSGLADFSFAMQGLGTGAITLAGSPAQKDRYLPGVRAAPASPPSPCRRRRPGPTWPRWRRRR